jgi:hypothetical protein
MAAAVLFFVSAPAQAALVGLWTFEGSAGDSSGLGNNGTLMNGATIVADDPHGAGQSLAVNGGSQHVLVPHDQTLNIVGQGTFAAWVRPIGNIGWDGVLAKNPSNGSALNHAGNYELRIENGTRRPTFHYQQGGVNDTIARDPGAGALVNDVWTHVAVTTTASGNATFYVNGAVVGSQPLNQNYGATNFNPLFIGSRADLFTVMNGRLDDVAVFDHVLTASEISDIMGGNFNAFLGTTEPLYIQGVTATASSQLGGGFDRAASHTVDGSGFNPVSGTHSNGLEGVHWLNVGSSGAFGTPDLNPSITFDLGSVMAVQDMLVWNYNETDVIDLTNRGVQNATVQVSNDGIVFTDLFNTTLLEAPGVTNVDYHQTVPLNVNARFIRLANLTNYGDPNGFRGLSEVRFTAQIPEPATALLGLLGVGGLLARRRRAA